MTSKATWYCHVCEIVVVVEGEVLACRIRMYNRWDRSNWRFVVAFDVLCICGGFDDDESGRSRLQPILHRRAF